MSSGSNFFKNYDEIREKQNKMLFFCEKIWWLQKKFVPLHSQNRNDSFGALVQLVRMPACHAGGHGFESRTHRKKRMLLASFFVILYI